MIRRKISAVCVLLVAWGGLAVAADDEPRDAAARIFVEDTLRGVGAEKVACSPRVIEQVRAQKMSVVCARFDGDFARFELRWDLQMILNEPSPDDDPADWKPTAEPQTDWELNGVSHDRIYRVGNKAVGVRFSRGELLLIW